MKQKLARELRRLAAQGRKVLLKLRLGNRWNESGGALARRQYPSYEDYLAHQRTKLDAFRDKSIRKHDQRFFEALCARLAALPHSFHRRTALCLAARQGSEVRAFIAQGAFAVGIDLNPGQGNRYVLVGDFHDLQFADGTVDVVYTNSLDHAFDLNRLLAEVRRVLTPAGLLIAEFGLGSEAGEEEGRGFYEALAWTNPDELIRGIEAAGFQAGERTEFSVPWRGIQVLFRSS